MRRRTKREAPGPTPSPGTPGEGAVRVMANVERRSTFRKAPHPDLLQTYRKKGPEGACSAIEQLADREVVDQCLGHERRGHDVLGLLRAIRGSLGRVEVAAAGA